MVQAVLLAADIGKKVDHEYQQKNQNILTNPSTVVFLFYMKAQISPKLVCHQSCTVQTALLHPYIDMMWMDATDDGYHEILGLL